MKRALAALACIIFLSSPALAASKDINSWLKTVGGKLNLSQSKTKKKAAVAGVKGALERDGDDLYWKKSGIEKEEARSFTRAVDLIEAGDDKEGIKALEAFIRDYPKSTLKADAEDGINILRNKKD